MSATERSENQTAISVTVDEAALLRSLYILGGASVDELVEHAGVKPEIVAAFVKKFDQLIVSDHSDQPIITFNEARAPEVPGLYETQMRALLLRDAREHLKNIDSVEPGNLAKHLDHIAGKIRWADAYHAKFMKEGRVINAGFDIDREASHVLTAFFNARHDAQEKATLRHDGREINQHTAHKYGLCHIYGIDLSESVFRDTPSFYAVKNRLEWASHVLTNTDVRVQNLKIAEVCLCRILHSINERKGFPGMDATEQEIAAVRELQREFIALKNVLEPQPIVPAGGPARKLDGAQPK